jgi:hypothetical protein
MAIELSSDQLDALPVAMKVWQSLCCQSDTFASPDWHADVLVERRQRLVEGSAKRIPWNEAKAQLQRLT